MKKRRRLEPSAPALALSAPLVDAGDTTYFDYGDPEGAISPYPLDVIIDREGNIAYLRREFDAEAMIMTIDRLLAE